MQNASPKLERPEVKEIEKRVKELKERLKQEESVRLKEEKVKEEIKNYLKEFQSFQSTAAPPIQTRDEADEIKDFSKGEQVGALVSIALEEGLPKAISVARSLNDPAVLDEFHDTLVDYYYDILVKKGVL